MPPRRLEELRDPVAFTVDGEEVLAERGESVATALVAAGRLLLGRSVKYHRPRGPACFEGRCDGCLMRVDGVPNVMTCQAEARAGMEVETQNVLGTVRADVLALTDWFFPEGMDHHHMFTRFGPVNRVMQKVARRVAGVGTIPDGARAPIAPRDARVDVLVIGGGRSGLEAANAAAREGASVWLVEAEQLGAAAAARGEGVPAPGPPVEVREGTLAVGVFDEVGFGFTTGEPEPAEPVRWVLLEDARGLIRLRPRALVVATGAFAGAEAFAGNDRPGVLSPRAALRLLDAGVLVGERVALIGAGPELERAAARLKAAGAETLGPFEASGVDAVGGRPSVRYLRVGETKHACDAVLSAAPPTGAYVLAGQAGVGLRFDGRGFLVAADEHGRTAHPAVFAAGRCTGRVGEGAARQAREAGRGAARVARGEAPAPFTPERPSPAPAERGALPRSASDKVVVCRCEDVTLHELEEAVARGHRDLEAAKRYTGFATGWCQGKQCVSLCARALAALGGEVADAPITPRPPLRPVPLAELARLVDDGEGA